MIAAELSVKPYAVLDLAKLDNVPAQLRNLPVWLLWKAVKTNGDKKPKKIPYYCGGGSRGETDTDDDRGRLVTCAHARASFDPNRVCRIRRCSRARAGRRADSVSHHGK